MQLHGWFNSQEIILYNNYTILYLYILYIIYYILNKKYIITANQIDNNFY